MCGVAEQDTTLARFVAVPDAVFVERWRKGLQYRGFSQVWRSPETGAVTDFATIADAAELAAASDRAEAEWERQVERLVAGRFTALRRECPGRSHEELEMRCRAEVATQDLYYLAKHVLGYGKLRFHLHYPMAMSVQDLPPGYRGLRQFCRDSYKTTVMGISKMIQVVLQDPEERCLFKSNAEGNAKNKVAEARAHFLNNRLFRLMFPGHVPQRKADEGSEGEFTTPARTMHQQEASFTAAGVGSSKTGQHYTFIFGDDFWDEKSVTSAEKTTTTMRELGGLQYMLASPAEGRILFIATRFAHDDPTPVLDTQHGYDCVIVSGILGCGRSILPEALPVLEMQRQAHSDGFQFSCQIILSPSTEALALPRFGRVRYAELHRLELLGQLRTRKLILTDASGSRTKTSDEAAIETVMVDHTGRIVTIGSVCRKMSPSEFVDAVFEEADRWGADDLVVQKATVDTVIVSFIEDRNAARLKEGKRSIPIRRYSLGQEEKKRRITNALQPLLKKGLLYVDPDLPDAVELEREAQQHPNTARDHRLDALSALGDPSIREAPSAPVAAVAAEPFEPPTKETVREEVQEFRRGMTRRAAARAELETSEVLVA